uniref:Uncharacterized protein n=1 Tax=Anguilla anguilla TaxID=7936 RepID=A0A0E9QPF8_ANGAN
MFPPTQDLLNRPQSFPLFIGGLLMQARLLPIDVFIPLQEVINGLHPVGSGKGQRSGKSWMEGHSIQLERDGGRVGNG